MMLLRASFAARILAILLAIYGVLSFSISASGGPGKALQSTSLRMADDDFPDAIMYEMPVSNAGARCRYIIYEKVEETPFFLMPVLQLLLNGTTSPPMMKHVADTSSRSN